MARNCKLKEDYQPVYNSVDLSKDMEIIPYKPYSKDVFMYFTTNYTVSTSGIHGMSKDVSDSCPSLNGRPLTTTGESTNNTATFANGEYSLVNVFTVRGKCLVATIDPTLAFGGHAHSRAGVAPFTTPTGYRVAKLDSTSLDLYNRNQIGTAYINAPIY